MTTLTKVEKLNLETLVEQYRKLKTDAEREAFKYVCPAKLLPFVLSDEDLDDSAFDSCGGSEFRLD